MIFTRLLDVPISIFRWRAFHDRYSSLLPSFADFFSTLAIILLSSFSEYSYNKF